MIIVSQSKKDSKCELDFNEEEECVYLNLYKNKRKVLSWEIFSGFRNNYSYDFYHDMDYDVDDIINIFECFDKIKKSTIIFIVEHNIFKDQGEKYFNREVSNQVYEYIMKEYELWR